MVAGVLVEAFCRTVGAVCAKQVKIVPGGGFGGDRLLAGKVEKMGAKLDLSIMEPPSRDNKTRSACK